MAKKRVCQDDTKDLLNLLLDLLTMYKSSMANRWREVMSLIIFMSENMFRSRDQSAKLQSERFIYKHGVVFVLPALGPDTTLFGPV